MVAELAMHEGRVAVIVRTMYATPAKGDKSPLVPESYDIIYLLDQPLSITGQYSAKTNTTVTEVPSQRRVVPAKEVTIL